MPQNNSVILKYNTTFKIAQLTPEERLHQQLERREKYERDRINALNYSYKQGYEEGYKQGYKEGYKTGLQLVSQLALKLMENNRFSEFLKASSDIEYRNKLLKEFGLD